ncbi:ABC transporter ATP-binding protein [Thermotalea metallivorans]|uniref:Oligopeptide transport ATP-binding protein OppF n=1 Tax=Thermotalea metallivorans TaxID=520762 RepID=A0A140KZQ9_9FIRM|nr:oligopeptide/dipeptide ABC transporter ATP-binding protein [Thermotalea metallivorans]KXG73784.1 Oligopeptide transport ATP-binding protein OppF [Thermotalea metallivorans]
MNDVILSVKRLKKYFPIRAGVFQRTVGFVKAVDDISLELKRGETLGLVGESGCGKSTTGRTILRLIEKTDGEVFFEGKDIYRLKREELRRLRPNMQIIFQDPYSSLNPRMTVGEIIGEALIEHKVADKNTVEDKVQEVLEMCGLSLFHMKRYPHEFSGGQRQRIGIARVLALKPKFIVCDEPVSALDVSIQSQIVNLLCELQQKFHFSYLFISHDLSVVKHISHRVGVMYLGSLVELADKKEIYTNPLHPYTQALLSAVPVADPTVQRVRNILEGDIPSPANPPKGCKFHTRCPYTKDICRAEVPEYKNVGNNHFVACHRIGR